MQADVTAVNAVLGVADAMAAFGTLRPVTALRERARLNRPYSPACRGRGLAHLPASATSTATFKCRPVNLVHASRDDIASSSS